MSYLVLHLSGHGDTRVEALQFNAREVALSALAEVRSATDDVVTIQSDTGEVLQARRDIIVGSTVTDEPVHETPPPS